MANGERLGSQQNDASSSASSVEESHHEQEGNHSSRITNQEERRSWNVGDWVTILVYLEIHRSVEETRVVRGYIQKLEGDSVIVYSRYGFGRVARAAILGQCTAATTVEHMEQLKASRTVDRRLEDLPSMTELFPGSILPERDQSDQASWSNSESSSSSSSDHSHRGNRRHQQGATQRQHGIPPRHPVQHHQCSQNAPMMAQPNCQDAPMMAQPNSIQGVPVPYAPAPMMILIAVPAGYQVQNVACLPQGYALSYQPYSQSAGCF